MRLIFCNFNTYLLAPSRAERGVIISNTCLDCKSITIFYLHEMWRLWFAKDDWISRFAVVLNIEWFTGSSNLGNNIIVMLSMW